MSQAPGPGRRAAVTLEAVAKHVQVSRATVSLVLRGSPLVAAATRERVQAAMAELGYIYNRGAAKLRASSSKVIGVLIADLGNPFFGEMTAGVDHALSDADWAVFLTNTGESVAKQDIVLRRMREHGVDGVIVCPAAGSDERLIHQLADWGLPCVQASRYVSLDGSDCVTTDYARGMRDATEHLIGLGHRRIALIGGDRQHSATTARCEGYLAAMRHAGLEDRFIGVATTRGAGADALNHLLDSREPPTAAVCYNDFVAHGAITALADRGMLAGRDFALVGFDDMNEASFCRPALTTIKTRPYEIGERAGQMLLARMANPDRPFDRVVFPAELVVRESCGAAQGAALGADRPNAHNAVRQPVGA